MQPGDCDDDNDDPDNHDCDDHDDCENRNVRIVINVSPSPHQRSSETSKQALNL